MIWQRLKHAFVLFLGLFGCSPTIYVHGVPNLAKVEDGVWRSGQPLERDQWNYLYSTLGIRHIVKLNFESEGSDQGAVAAGMVVHTLSIQPAGDEDLINAVTNAFTGPDQTMLDEAERVLEQQTNVLVHCTRGRDRTGLVIGIFRVKAEGWSKEAAYSEMLEHGFTPQLHGLHEYWENFQP
jgi:tyrosine-protein phosphatase SIW14